MQAFKSLTGIAAPLPMANIDTDMIIPKQFLRTIKRTGLGENLFDELRYDDLGNKKNDFVLNQSTYCDATILVAGENFGCGSSREHAPWALLDFGIRCVIAPSFADIFYNNSFKNGILPIILPSVVVDKILTVVANVLTSQVTVDLEQQKVSYHGGRDIFFEIDSFRRKCLLEGLDDIDLTLQEEKHIVDYELDQEQNRLWVAVL